MHGRLLRQTAAAQRAQLTAQVRHVRVLQNTIVAKTELS